MLQFQVNKKSELTLVKEAYEAAGFRVFRVRTECQCKNQGNRRDGLIVLDGDRLVVEVVRCKECAKHDPNK